MHTIISFPQKQTARPQAPLGAQQKNPLKKLSIKKIYFQAETFSMKSAEAMLLARPPKNSKIQLLSFSSWK